MKTWSYEEEVIVAKHYKKHIDNYRSRKPNWKFVEEIMDNPLIIHSETDVKCRLRNFIAIDEEAFLVGYTNASKQTQFLFDKFVAEEIEGIGFNKFVNILVNTKAFQSSYQNPAGMNPDYVQGFVHGMFKFVLPEIAAEIEREHQVPREHIYKEWQSVIRDALWWPKSDIEEYK